MVLSTGTAVQPSAPYGDAFPTPSMARAEKQYVVPGVPVNVALVAVVVAKNSRCRHLLPVDESAKAAAVRRFPVTNVVADGAGLGVCGGGPRYRKRALLLEKGEAG